MGNAISSRCPIRHSRNREIGGQSPLLQQSGESARGFVEPAPSGDPEMRTSCGDVCQKESSLFPGLGPEKVASAGAVHNRETYGSADGRGQATRAQHRSPVETDRRSADGRGQATRAQHRSIEAAGSSQ